MKRRSIIQALLATLIPLAKERVHSTAKIPDFPKLPATPDQDIPFHGTDNPDWLEAWLRLPMLPILDSEWFAPADRLLFISIWAHLNLGQPFEFFYHGGSEPGERRRVRPVLIFRKFDSQDTRTEIPASDAYLLAFCCTRNAPRTFRLDRIRWVGDG